MKNEREFKFNVTTPPSEELIQEFHRDIAKDLIALFGADTMREVLRQIEERESNKVTVKQ